MTNDKISAKQQRCFYFLNLMYANKLQIGHLSGVEAVKLAKVGSMMLTMARQLGLVDDKGTHTPPQWIADVAPTLEDVDAVRKLMAKYNADSLAKVAEIKRANKAEALLVPKAQHTRPMIGKRVIYQNIICTVCVAETLSTSFNLWVYNPRVGHKHGVSLHNVKALPNGQL